MAETNIGIQAFALAVTVILIFCDRFDKRGVDKSNRMMNAMLWINFMLLSCNIGSWIVEGKPQFTGVNYVLTFGASSLGFPMAAFYIKYIAYIISDSGGNVCVKLVKAVTILCGLGLLLNFLSIFNHMYFSCEGGVYARGPIFWLNQSFSAFIILPALALIFLNWRYLNNRIRIGFIAYTVLPLIAGMSQFAVPQLNLMGLSTTLSLLIVYLTVYVERKRWMEEKEESIAMSRMAVMLTQIQPHFLYNTLAVIQDMCHGKAPEAEMATIEFSEFLRGNLAALNAAKPIPFIQVLRHAQSYLALEKRCFGDRLKVEYDIQTTAFRLPALTLQPIIENAVRHGVMQMEQGGTVCIYSYETPENYVVTIIDDGVGFDVEALRRDRCGHIGIANVEERLKTMCGARLKITSSLNKGTTVSIIVPKGEKYYENTCSG